MPQQSQILTQLLTCKDHKKAEPRPGCLKCDRLVAYRRANKKNYPDYFNGATGSFGAPLARIAIIGLAPGLHGANQTGRPFTGDQSGHMLFDCLIKEGFATGPFENRPDDGLVLHNTLITNAVRCAPPENKPTRQEVINCRPFLKQRLKAMPNLKVIFALGKIAHDTILKTYDLALSKYPFAHNACYTLPEHGLILISSYHCSRYNVNTGRITENMLRDALKQAKTAAGLD